MKNNGYIRSETEHMIACLLDRTDDKLCLDAARELEVMREERLKLQKRIHQQRIALRSNWQIIESRASHKKAWYPSPLLIAILKKSSQKPLPRWQRYLGHILSFLNILANPSPQTKPEGL